MKSKLFRIGGAFATAATLSLSAAPALARSGVYIGSGWGWGGGWGHHRHHDDLGDILAGVLIVGGIAAVASAAANADRNRHAPPYRYPGAPDARRGANYGDGRPEWRPGGSIDAAVDRCVGEVERGDAQVGEVERVNRDGDGWRIDGRLRSGQPFGCVIDAGGHIRNVNVEGRAVLPGN